MWFNPGGKVLMLKGMGPLYPPGALYQMPQL